MKSDNSEKVVIKNAWRGEKILKGGDNKISNNKYLNFWVI